MGLLLYSDLGVWWGRYLYPWVVVGLLLIPPWVVVGLLLIPLGCGGVTSWPCNWVGVREGVATQPRGRVGGGGEGRCACILLLQSHVVNPGTAVRRARVPLPVALAKFLLCLVLVSLGGINSLI